MSDVYIPKQHRARITPQVVQDILLAQRLYDAGDFEACIPVIKRFLKRPAFAAQPLTYDALGTCAQQQGQMAWAVKCFRRALVVDPDYVEAHNRIIMILDADPTTTVAIAQQERDHWWRLHGARQYARRIPSRTTRDPERPIRVGYVSGDFQYHSACTVFHRIIHGHSDAVEVFVYSNTPYSKYDHITNAYRVLPGWRDIVDWPDSLVADKIRDDRIDILVDLSGFTGDNRLPVFCYQPAPIQLTGWGYATGTGLPAMQGLITDRLVVPEDRRQEHREQLVYLPCVIDYEGVDGLPEAVPLPCLTARPTFGVFQRALKINATDCEVWRQILARLPESRLICKSRYSKTLQLQMAGWFGAQWPQVEIRDITSSYEHKLGYQEVDVCLDCWPQTAGVSACDALYMGVPHVTLIGPRVIQRTTASLLTVLGLEDFIAETEADYVDKAVAWVTTRKDELAVIRAGLRARFVASPIIAGYVEAVEVAYRDLFRAWCAKGVSLADARKRLEMAMAS